MPGRLGDRPAVVIFQLHQQPAHHLPAALPGLPPGKASGHPPQQVLQERTGHHPLPWQQRLLHLDRVSQPVMIAAAAPYAVVHLTCTNKPMVTNYCCRTRAARPLLEPECRHSDTARGLRIAIGRRAAAPLPVLGRWHSLRSRSACHRITRDALRQNHDDVPAACPIGR